MLRLLTLALLLVSTGSAFGAPARISLFDGKSLQGWHVAGCKAGVEDGKLVIQEGDGLVRTDHRYRDFILEFSYKPRRAEKYDAGIYIRAELPATGQPWPAKHQVNLKHGDELNLIGFKDARSSGLVKPGEWNQCKLTVVGETAEMVINGQSAWKTAGIKELDGFIGIQVEVAGGGQFEFKEIAITELDYTPLFNGKDLAGWEGADQEAAACWRVSDGLVECTGEKGPWLRSDKEYGDYNLRLAYKLKAGGNSGVYIRVPKDGKHHGEGAGIEVQVLDDRAERYAKLEPYQYTGSLYAMVAADPRVAREAGEWNTLEIDCRGTSYVILHNGVRVINASERDQPALAQRLTKGFLGLQNHSEQVWFRDVRIGASLQAAPVESPR